MTATSHRTLFMQDSSLNGDCEASKQRIDKYCLRKPPFRLLSIDHVVLNSTDAQVTKNFFVDKLGFKRCHIVDNEVVRGQCRFRLQPLSKDLSSSQRPSSDLTKHGISQPETASDICILVSGFDNLIQHLERVDPCSILEFPRREKHNRLGLVDRVVIKSIVGNVVHTVMEVVAKEPIDPVLDLSSDNPDPVSGIDHVAFACRIGETEKILKWYESVFCLSRFDFGEDGNGIRIETGTIGMHLQAMEFWRCSEVGLRTLDSPCGQSFPLIVVAEPLPDVDKNNQLDIFINDHGGPGVQHIGICTENICATKAAMRSKGVDFIEPPSTYYNEIGKLEDIKCTGEDEQLLQQHGILIDIEDFNDKRNYLMQVFMKPLFRRRTFFLELIQRCGARGFGAGNITALFRAVQAFMSKAQEIQKV